MSRVSRKALAFLLSAMVLLAGTGFGGSFATELGHELGVETVAGSNSGDESSREAGCDHCCVCHFSIHLLSIAEEPVARLMAAAVDKPAPSFGQAEIPSLPESFFRPPRLLLA